MQLLFLYVKGNYNFISVFSFSGLKNSQHARKPFGAKIQEIPDFGPKQFLYQTLTLQVAFSTKIWSPYYKIVDCKNPTSFLSLLCLSNKNGDLRQNGDFFPVLRNNLTCLRPFSAT